MDKSDDILSNKKLSTTFQRKLTFSYFLAFRVQINVQKGQVSYKEFSIRKLAFGWISFEKEIYVESYGNYWPEIS